MKYKAGGVMSTLNKYRNNVYSQNGEDGVIKEICSRLDIKNGSFVEFGAWDGKYLSNTYCLLEQGWKGVYIEGDKEKFDVLVRNMMDYKEKVTLLQAYVRKEGDHCLDNLLSKTSLEKDFDLLSIDVDSFDWHIWNSLNGFQPKIVVIETNSSIPPGIVQTHREDGPKGSSFTAMVELGKSKGYTPVCHTGNLIFIKNHLIEKLHLTEEEIEFPELLFDYRWKNLFLKQPIPVPLDKLMMIPKKLKKVIKGI